VPDRDADVDAAGLEHEVLCGDGSVAALPLMTVGALAPMASAGLRKNR
jgi:hypothetical protein